MALGEKTLTPSGLLVGVAGSPVGSTQMLEDLVDAVKATELVANAAATVAGAAVVAGAVRAQLLSVGPVAAKSTTAVHALYDDTTAAFPGPFTNPDVPRNLTVTFSASWDGGDVTVTGTDQFDAAVSEVFADVAATTVAGVKIFKTVTGATKETPAGVAGNGASIGTGDKVGLSVRTSDTVGVLWVGTTQEATTIDTTYEAFTPTTLPSATTYKVLVNVAL